ncbi:MAG: ATP-binding protein [Pseudomonadota bacterium]
MSQQTQSTHHVARPEGVLGEKLGHLVGVGIGCLLAAVFLPFPTLAPVVFFSGIGLLSVALLVLFVEFRRARGQEALFRAVATFVENDASPSFTTDADGCVDYQNSACIQRFGQKSGASLVAVLGGVIASPSALLHRLQVRADVQGAAREDAALRRGHLRVSVHKIGGRGYLWRLEEVAEFGALAGSSEGIGLPMLTVSKSGTVLFMNEPMRQLVGQRHKTLDRIIDDLPVRPGDLHQITTERGGDRATIVEVPGAAGRRELYFLPSQSDGGCIDRGMVDILPVPIVVMSRSGVIQAANRMASDLLRIENSDQASLGELIEGLGRPLQDWIAEVAERGTPARPEFVRATRAPQDTYIQVTLSRFEKGDEAGVVAVLNDATELKTLEAQFVQSQKMQAIGQLAGGVAHDFNNLLTAISGHCDLLLLRRDPGDPDYADLEQINQNANRAASVVGQLLAFSRKQNLRPELLDLRDTMGDLTHLLNRLVGETITLNLSHETEDKMIRADRRQLEQVLMNLVVNARDAMPDGGTVDIEARLVTLRDELRRDRAVVPAGEYVMIRVRDQGTGILPENLPKIFEPFFTTKRSGEGTGLGLSTVYGIVKQSGGFIFADSEVGSGTSFTVYFPAQNPTKPRSAPTPVAVERRALPEGAVVLLVEDEAPVRAFASRALRLRGFTVLEASNAEEALQKLTDNSLDVDVFVTDVIMPGMDGPTWVAEALKQRPDTRVIFVSGYAEESFAEGQARIPDSVFLPKPFSLTQLTETVQAQLH